MKDPRLPLHNPNPVKGRPYRNSLPGVGIRLKARAAVGTRPENVANGYFDLSDPIRTNTTVNTIWVPTLDPDVLDTVLVTASQKGLARASLQIQPNPSKGQVEINTSESGTLEIMDLRGSILGLFYVESGVNRLALHKFPKGTYFLRMKNSQSVLTRMLILD